jgi:hypothetical protein
MIKKNEGVVDFLNIACTGHTLGDAVLATIHNKTQKDSLPQMVYSTRRFTTNLPLRISPQRSGF